LLERVQRLEAEQAALHARLEGDRQLRVLTAQVVGAAQVGDPVEKFGQAMRTQPPCGRAGGLARARTAWRYFMPESEKEAFREEYERFAAGGRARATGALRNSDGTFARHIG
jgi:hypothetical protein